MGVSKEEYEIILGTLDRIITAAHSILLKMENIDDRWIKLHRISVDARKKVEVIKALMTHHVTTYGKSQLTKCDMPLYYYNYKHSAWIGDVNCPVCLGNWTIKSW